MQRRFGSTSYALQKRRSERQRQRLIKKGLLVDFRKQPENHEFKFEWMKFYEWVVPVKDNKYEAHCTRCNLNLDIRSTGHLALLTHEKSEKHRNNWSHNTGGEHRHDTNNYASTQSGILPIESPNTAETYFDLSRVKIETIDDDDDDDSSLKTVSPSHPQAPPVVRNADKSPNLLVTSTDLSSRYQTNLPNYNFTIDEGSSMKRLDNVINTREFDDGSRLGLLRSALLGSITSLAADSPSTGGQSVFLAHKDDNVAVSSVSSEPSQTGTTMEKSSSYSSISSSSVAVEQELENVEMTFEVDNSYPSVPSSPTAMEQTPQNAGMIFEIESNACTTPAATEETHQSVKMALKKVIDYPSTSAVSTATVPTKQNTEKSVIHPPSSGPLTGPNKKHLIVLLDRYSEPSSRKHEAHFPHSNNSSENEAESAQYSPKTLQTAQRLHALIREKSNFKNELRSIFERFDEAERVYENKCRIIMEDYKMLLNELSHESDHTFLPNDIFMPEYGSAWNSLKLIKILLGEENSSENSFPENKQNTIDSQHGNGLNYEGNFSINQTGVFSGGHVFSYNSREIRKPGRPRKQKVWQLFGKVWNRKK